MDFVEYYYNTVCGCYPDHIDDEARTYKTFEYLKDAGFSEEEMYQLVDRLPAKAAITPNDLPEKLWENSLIKKDRFYFHRCLHIKPKAPRFNLTTQTEVVEPFFLEMKIRFTISDLINYFYTALGIDQSLADEKRDAGSFNYLLKKYERTDVEPLDFILCLIDYAASDEIPISSPLDLKSYETEVLEYLRRLKNEADAANANKIVWR